MLDEPERVSVRIDRKQLKQVYDRLHKAGRLAMDYRSFLRMGRMQQVGVIFREGTAQDRLAVKILTDPKRMREFERKVQPIVLRGCATSACHGGAGAGTLQLFNDRTRTPATTYANFYCLDEYEKDGRRLINRDQPDQSLLLSFGLPADERAAGLPGHPTPIKPVFRSTSNRDYQTMLDWLMSLSIERPDYAIDLAGGGTAAGRRPGPR